MPKAKPDWDKIKAEYLAGGTSYRKLAEKYGVSFTTLKRKAKQEAWTQKRTQTDHRSEDKIIENISEKKADEATEFLKIIHEANVRLLSAVVNGDVKEAQTVSALARAIKELGAVQGFVFGDYDRREREARIAALKKQAEKEERPEGIKLIIEGVTDADIKEY